MLFSLLLVFQTLLLFSLFADRHNIGIATFLNMFLLGYIIQFTLGLLQMIFPAPTMLTRWVSLLVSIVCLCFASSLYMTADLGVSTYDAVAVVLSRKWKLGKFQYVRIGCDLVCVVGGVVLFLLAGGVPADIPAFVGIGTIITAFFMGPLIAFFNRTVAEPMLHR